MMSSDLQRQNLPKSNGGGSTNLVNGSSIQFEYNNQNQSQSQISTNETSGTKKNKKKKKKSKAKKSSNENGETISELSFNDPDFVYPDSRILKQNSNGDVIVQSLEPQHQQKSNTTSVNNSNVNTLRSTRNSKSNSDKLIPDDPDDLNEQLKEYWTSLSPDEKKNLLNLERDSVFKVMKEQQKITCNCSVCGRKRQIIEHELKNLYDNYFDGIDTQELIAAELFNINNKQQTQLQRHNQDQHYNQNNVQNRSRNGSSSNIQQQQQQQQQQQHQQQQRAQKQQQQNQQQNQQITEQQQASSSMQQQQQQTQRSNKSSDTQRRNGIMSVAEDLLQNDGKKFLEMMEKLAESRIQRQNQYNRKVESFGSNATNNQIEEEEEEDPQDFDNEDDEDAFEDEDEDEEGAEYEHEHNHDHEDEDGDEEYFDSETEHVQHHQQGIDSEYLEEDQITATNEKERRVLIQLQLQRQRELQSQLQREKQELRLLQDDAVDNLDDGEEFQPSHDHEHDESDQYVEQNSRSSDYMHQHHNHVHPHQHQHQGHHHHHHGLDHQHQHQQGQSDMDEGEDEFEDELEDYEEEDDEVEEEEYSDDGIDEEQQLEEGRQMLQLCTTKMLRQSLLEAYKRKKQEEYTKALLSEIEKEETLKKQKEEKKQREREKKREKKRLQQQQKEEERLRKEADELRKQEEKEAENKRKQEEGVRRKQEEERKKAEEKRKKEQAKREKEEQKKKLAEAKKKKQEEELMKKQQEEQRLIDEKLEIERKAKEELEKQEELKRQKAEEELRQQQLKEEELALQKKLRDEELLRKQQAEQAQQAQQAQKAQQAQSQPQIQLPPHLSQRPLQQQQVPLQQQQQAPLQQSQFFEERSSSITSNPELHFAQSQQHPSHPQSFIPSGSNPLFEGVNVNHQTNSPFFSSPLAPQAPLNRQGYSSSFSNGRNDTPPGLPNLNKNMNGFAAVNGLDSQLPTDLFGTKAVDPISPWNQNVSLSTKSNSERFSPFFNTSTASQQPQQQQPQQSEPLRQQATSQFLPQVGDESTRSSIDNLTDTFASSKLGTGSNKFNSNFLNTTGSSVWSNNIPTPSSNLWGGSIWNTPSNSNLTTDPLAQSQNSNPLNVFGSQTQQAPPPPTAGTSASTVTQNPLGFPFGSQNQPPQQQPQQTIPTQFGTQSQGFLNNTNTNNGNDQLTKNYQSQIVYAYKFCKEQAPFEEYIDVGEILRLFNNTNSKLDYELFMRLCNSKSNSHKFETQHGDDGRLFLKVTELSLANELGSAVPRASSIPFNQFNGGNDIFGDSGRNRSFGNGSSAGGLNWGSSLLQ